MTFSLFKKKDVTLHFKNPYEYTVIKRVFLLCLAALTALTVTAQNNQWDRLDILISKAQYATAYPIAQRYWQQTEQKGSGADRLTAAFYLTTLDYAYSKDVADSALMRYSLLARRLQGVDRAVAYAFLFQTYGSLYSKYYYRMERQKPSDDPNRKYPLWHLKRMQDTLTKCADSVLAYADLLRTADLKAYRYLFATDSLASPAMDSTLFGVLVQTLLTSGFRYFNTYTLTAHQLSSLLLPMPQYAQSTDSTLPYPLTLHYRVAQHYLDLHTPRLTAYPSQEGTAADVMLWLDLQRYEACYYLPRFATAIDTLAEYYRPHLATNEMKAMLSLQQAKYLDFEHQKVQAEQLCLETERLYPDTYGARRCRMLRYDINEKEYKIHYGEVESSKRSRLACVEARNISLLNFRLVKEELIPDSLKRLHKMDTLLCLPAVAEWQQVLPDSGDHLMHQYLVALPPAPQGEYYLVAYTDSSFCYDEFKSADATYITYHMPPSANRLTELHPSSGHLVDRLTGQPIVGSRVTLHSMGELTDHYYHRRCRTDKEGYFHFPTSSPMYLLKEAQDLSARVDGYEYYYQTRYWNDVFSHINEPYDSKLLEIVLTDRPIYRLGDTVHFCCVAYRKHERGKGWQPRLRPAANVKLIATFGIRYNNGGEDTLRLTTDRHGRCWGEFVIPTDGRNGDYDLDIMSPDHYTSMFGSYYESRTIHVEAYKPPHFMVTLSATQEGGDTAVVHRFGQPITIYGTAASYSGAPMTGAKVKWEVSCEKMDNPLQYNTVANDFPHHDSLFVDDDGNFQFTFVPKKDDNSVRASRPLFRGVADRPGYEKSSQLSTYIYTAYARVTDADGELHEQHLSFHVSEADGYCLLTTDDLSHLTFAYNNFDHQPLKGAVRVELYQLRQPDTIRTLDPLMADKYHYPDARWVGTRKEFYRLFPYKAFNREDGDHHSWPVVAKRLDQTTEERTLTITDLPSGMYRITFHTPDGNQHDTLVNYVAPNGRVTGDDVVWLRTTPKRDWTYYPTITCRVGDTVRFDMGSPYGNQPLYYRVVHAAKTYQKGMLLLDSNHTTTLSIPITKRMKEGCVVVLSAIREGRTFATSYGINVVHPDLLLNISTETFRDRLQPGEQEQWRIRITNADSAGVAANLSLTMYDKSLEELENYRPIKLGFWPWARRYEELRTLLERWEMEDASSRPLFYSPFKNLGLIPPQPKLGFGLSSLADYYRQAALRHGPGTIVGSVIDGRTQEPVPFANVVLLLNGKQVFGTQTDFDGNFTFKGVPKGEYEIVVSCVGYHKLTKSVTIDHRGLVVLKVTLMTSATTLECVMIKDSEKIPVIEIGSPETGQRMSADDISRMPGGSVESIVATVGGVGTARGENGMVTMQGHVRKRTGVNVPKEAIAEISAPFNFDGTASDAPAALRKNLSTLALFEPALRSDKEGRVSVSFTLPDALTQWQLYGFAWSDRFQIGTINRTIQSQKELMVQPLMPRFLRQGDTIEIRAKVSNLTDSTMTVEVGFGFENGELHTPRLTAYPSQEGTAAAPSTLTISPRSSDIYTTRFAVPTDWHVADYKVYAVKTSTTGGHHSDGEQGQLPVLSNRERITTSHLLYVPGSTDGKEVVRTFDISLPAPAPGDSTTLSFTPNPIRYVVEALPHFKRHRMPGRIYLANSIYVNCLYATLNVKPDSPNDTLSPKERQRLHSRIKSDVHQLITSQNYQGGWSWMPGGNNRTSSCYVTEAVLQRLAACSPHNREQYYRSQYLQAVNYLDNLIVEEKNNYLHTSELSTLNIPLPHCLPLLYTRSLYLGTKPLDQCDSATRKAFDFFYQLYKKHIYEPLDLHTQGQLALLMLHMGDTADAVSLATRIKESAHTDDQLGMYWNNNTSGYGWYQRPIENAALMVDVFADVLHDWESVSRIQQWILVSKQGTTWRTDMATAAALQALTRQPVNSTLRQGTVTIKCNNQEVESGEFKVDSYPDAPANSQLSTLNFQLNNTSPLPAWGALFHSHDTPIDSIQYNGTGMTLRKTIYRVSDDGLVVLGSPTDELHVGERIRVHIDIDCLRGFENMVLRDQRAAGFEPVSTASGWQWNDGLRYYVDVRDDRIDCYIDYLAPDHYYVEYDLWVRHAGTFANGICTLQDVYAPEFRANTDSFEVRVKK